MAQLTNNTNKVPPLQSRGLTHLSAHFSTQKERSKDDLFPTFVHIFWHSAANTGLGGGASWIFAQKESCVVLWGALCSANIGNNSPY